MQTAPHGPSWHVQQTALSSSPPMGMPNSLRSMGMPTSLRTSASGSSAKCRVKFILGSAISFVLLWFSTIAVLIPGFLTPDIEDVFIQDGCVGGGPVTVFVLCLMEVTVASLLLGRYAVPGFFGRHVWIKYENLKKRKIVGMIAQIIVRFSCAIQLVVMVSPRFSLANGLFAEFNAKSAYAKMQQEHIVTTCGGGYDQDAYALRTWTFCKYHMIAIHIWELAYIPDLTTDAWLHHLFVIFVGSMGSDPQSLTGSPEIQPFIDSIGFSFILGASLNCFVKACVIMYHKTAPIAAAQAKWMWMSIAGALVLTILNYLLIPCTVVFIHYDAMGTRTSIMALVLIAFLVAVEVRLLLVKRIIAINATLKARRSATTDEPPRSPPATYTHDGTMQSPVYFMDAPMSFGSIRQLSLSRQLSFALQSPVMKFGWQEQEPEAMAFYETFG